MNVIPAVIACLSAALIVGACGVWALKAPGPRSQGQRGPVRKKGGPAA